MMIKHPNRRNRRNEKSKTQIRMEQLEIRKRSPPTEMTWRPWIIINPDTIPDKVGKPVHSPGDWNQIPMGRRNGWKPAKDAKTYKHIGSVEQIVRSRLGGRLE